MYKLLASNGEIYALKKVDLEGVDEAIIQGYLNEIQLLETFQNDERIIRLYDSEIDETKKTISMVKSLISIVNQLISECL